MSNSIIKILQFFALLPMHNEELMNNYLATIWRVISFDSKLLSAYNIFINSPEHFYKELIKWPEK